ncbi:hypothetical protein [Embleya scabrispora]|uniref:hypothetical protein n=1 Tax=Embleya scabrispora TaxID=159449 RepID=UPI0003811EEB|nr:hypothetical protein [Embleya scabrispora]MYS84940.1 hypothetical protein [Streptomyces sp. SID5474]
MDPLLAAALESLGVAEAPRPLTSDHTAAWRTRHWKIRTASEPADVAALLHEARAVTLLHDRHLHPAGAASGRLGDGAWVAIAWRPGTTLWDWCVAARRTCTPGTRVSLRRIAHRAFNLLAAFHAAGWRHGDIQPANILITPGNTVEFIDHDLAHHPDLPLPSPYRGGMDQSTAPEIARELLDGKPDAAVTLTEAAEIYSMGASLRWAWTGHAPATTRLLGPGVTAGDILGDIATGRHRAALTDHRPWADPELEALIETTTTRNPAHRSRNPTRHRPTGGACG